MLKEVKKYIITDVDKDLTSKQANDMAKKLVIEKYNECSMSTNEKMLVYINCPDVSDFFFGHLSINGKAILKRGTDKEFSYFFNKILHPKNEQQREIKNNSRQV